MRYRKVLWSTVKYRKALWGVVGYVRWYCKVHCKVGIVVPTCFPTSFRRHPDIIPMLFRRYFDAIWASALWRYFNAVSTLFLCSLSVMTISTLFHRYFDAIWALWQYISTLFGHDFDATLTLSVRYNIISICHHYWRKLCISIHVQFVLQNVLCIFKSEIVHNNLFLQIELKLFSSSVRICRLRE